MFGGFFSLCDLTWLQLRLRIVWLCAITQNVAR